MAVNVEDSISTKELNKQYNWYSEKFPRIVQMACDSFFTKNFKLEFISLSKNVNFLLNNESCFVTKVKVDDEYDMFFRLTAESVNIILDKILGKSKGRFDINKISDLESKIITSFNGYIYLALRGFIEEPDTRLIKRKNFDMINMTFLLKDLDENVKDIGKVIVSTPLALLKPIDVESKGPKFSSRDDFTDCNINVDVIVGHTRFSMYEVKHLEPGDVIVFEDSNLEKLHMSLLDRDIEINVNPLTSLKIIDNNLGGNDDMPEDKNLWDSIEVDLHAVFEAVKMSLGELKEIEEGLVVDIASLYNNKITLKVEDKSVATGTLVIVNDRYGVKIDKIMEEKKENKQIEPETKTAQADKAVTNEIQNEPQFVENESEPAVVGEEQNAPIEAPSNSNSEAEGDEEFDYSDFELEDENL